MAEPLRVCALVPADDDGSAEEERKTTLRSHLRTHYGYVADRFTRLPDQGHLTGPDGTEMPLPGNTVVVTYEVTVADVFAPTDEQLAARRGSGTS